MSAVNQVLREIEVLRGVTQNPPSQEIPPNLCRELVLALCSVQKERSYTVLQPHSSRILEGWTYTPEAARALLEEGADPNTKYIKKVRVQCTGTTSQSIEVTAVFTLLSGALGAADFEFAKILLKKGADPNEVNQYSIELPDGVSLDLFSMQGDVSEIEALPIFQIASFVDESGEFGEAGLVLDCVEMVAALLEAGAEVDALSYNNRTALQVAVVKDNLSVVKTLLEGNASFSVEDSRGEYFLCYRAALHNNLKMLKLLIEYEADPTLIGPKGESALGEAFKYCNQEMVDILLDAGASLDTWNSFILVFFGASSDDFLAILEMMLNTKQFETPKLQENEVNIESFLLAKLALSIQLRKGRKGSAPKTERERELAWKLYVKGATTEGALTMIYKTRGVPGEEIIRAREWLEGLVGGITKGAM